ncbi:MAG: sigma-54-dependent Fis family transcriptional regulator [Muribaculaceae bacterium]|nr:sigma-54-dependent Fis family transcriptional regulator [Muribaculaceae bacterium]
MPNTNNNRIQSVMLKYSIIGKSPLLINAIDRALRVAPTDFSVLVVGESGTGKEFFPKIIHDNSPRKHKKYIAVNCGAIPEGTIDSELFGHKKGAFTDAISDRKGYFEEADGGTIFLDEVGEMPLSTQARLLRVLESGEFIRMGENTPRKTNIRVVAATNKNMELAVKEGRFREDLYYRLSTVEIVVPPLRDRSYEPDSQDKSDHDVHLLMRKFLHEYEDANHLPETRFTDDAKQRLQTYHWPGNVRELRNVAQQIGLFEVGTLVDVNVLNQYLRNGGRPQLPANIDDGKFDYTKERELIFMLIKQLQHEIEGLKGALGGGESVPRVSAHVNELQRPMHQLPSGQQQAYDNAEWVQAEPHNLERNSGHQHGIRDLSHIDEVTALEVNPTHDHSEQHIKSLEDTEREVIMEALYRNNGRRKRTAKELKISERTLYRKIKQYGLERR